MLSQGTGNELRKVEAEKKETVTDGLFFNWEV